MLLTKFRFICPSGYFVPIGYQAWQPHAVLVSDWTISKQSSPLKLLSNMNRNLVGNIYMYGRLSDLQKCIFFGGLFRFPQRDSEM
jgi:hypothetical protein